MYYVPACVSLQMCVTATVTMAAMAACSYICSRRLRKAEGANRRSATQTQRLTGAAAGVHTCTYKYKHRGYSRHRQDRKRRAEKGAGVLTSRYFAPEAGTRHRSRPSRQFNSIQFNSKHPRHVSITHHASRITPLRLVGIKFNQKQGHQRLGPQTQLHPRDSHAARGASGVRAVRT